LDLAVWSIFTGSLAIFTAIILAEQLGCGVPR
jgi:hypothetical protein